MQGINAMEMTMEALKEIQLRFYKDFPPHPQEEVYGFATPSTMKPTQWTCKYWPFEIAKFISKQINVLVDVLRMLGFLANS